MVAQLVQSERCRRWCRPTHAAPFGLSQSISQLVVGAKQGASQDGLGRTKAYFSVRGSPCVTGATRKLA